MLSWLDKFLRKDSRVSATCLRSSEFLSGCANGPEIPVIPAQAVLRDVNAARFTVEIAERKANAVILPGVSSGDLRQNRTATARNSPTCAKCCCRKPGLPIPLAGGAPVSAVGVSGAPGGDLDADCAKIRTGRRARTT